MKKLLILVLFLIVACDHQWDNLLSTDEDLKNTPNIVQINLDSDNNIAILLDYAYSDSSSIILERQTLGGFEQINYVKQSQLTLVDTSFDKEIDHKFVYRVVVKRDKYQSAYSDKKKFIYTSSGLNMPQDLLAISVEFQGIRLIWKDISNYEESYKIEKDDGSGYSLLTSISANEENYFDAIPGPPPNPIQLKYRIMAIGNNKQSDWSEIAINYNGFGSPSNLKIVSNEYSLLKIAWDDNSNIESYYIIERKKDAGNFVMIDSVDVDVTQYSDVVPEVGLYTYRVCAIKDSQKSLYSNELSAIVTVLSPPIPVDGLLAYWPFNGNANDESGNGNNCFVNGASLTTDRFNNTASAYQFDGIDDYISVLNNDIGNLHEESTIGLWINPDMGNFSSNSDHRIIDKEGDGNGGWQIFNWSGATVFAFKLWQNSSVVGQISLIDQSSSNSWVYLLFTKQQNTFRFYVNGQLLITKSYTNDVSNSALLTIGRSVYWSSQYYIGKVDDVRIYDRALNNEEILTLYHENGWYK